jgi:hypothetical protein
LKIVVGEEKWRRRSGGGGGGRGGQNGAYSAEYIIDK